MIYRVRMRCIERRKSGRSFPVKVPQSLRPSASVGEINIISGCKLIQYNLSSRPNGVAQTSDASLQ